MDGTVRTRPNHYARLGVPTSASENEIREAFVKAMFAPHRMADAAQLGIAYELLRNPAKRRAYDEALGLRPVPQPAQGIPSAVAFRISARVVGARAEPQSPSSPTQSSADPDRGVGSFIARSLREPPLEAPPAVTIEELVAAPLVPKEIAVEADSAPTVWSRTGLAAAGAVLAVVLIGASAGLGAGDASEAQPVDTVTAKLPEARPATAGRAAIEVAAPAAARVQPVVLAVLTRPVRAAPKARSSDPSAEAGQASHHNDYEAAATDGAPEIAAADAGSAPAAAVETAAAATMPLAGKVIARTLHRIGYRCGDVASTSVVDGGAGVFKVSCTSGQTYRATPVRGRYHFSRWAAQ
jgi:hypothetical protein